MAVSEWDNSCRLCAEERTEMFSIFGDEGLRRKVAHKLRVCLPVMVYKTDPLPKKICQFCAARLDDAYEFREYCLNVYKSMHLKLLTLRDSKAVEIYMDAMNNSPDPCQVQLCKEKARAPPPLVPLPASLPLIKRVTEIEAPKVQPTINIGVEPLPELPCEVQIKEDPGYQLVEPDLTIEKEAENCRASSRCASRESKTEEWHENDVITLDDGFAEEETSNTSENIQKKEEKRTSILEQVLTGNLTINDCKELTPKTKLTSQWWCSPCNSYYRTKSSLMKHMQLFCPRTYTCSKCSLVCHTVEELAKHEATNHLKVTLDFDETLKECHQCDREFVSWEMLRHHRLRDHIAGSMEIGTNTWCPLCNRFFPTVELYYSHKQLHEAGTLMSRSTIQTSIPTSQIKESLNEMKKEHFVESVKYLTCPTCGKVCTQQSALSNHMRTHEPKKHKCEICGRSFGLFIRLAAHRLSEHGQQPIMSPITASVEQEEALNAEREAREAREARIHGSRNRTFSEILDDYEDSIEDQSNTKRESPQDANSSKNVARCGICQQWFNDHTTMLTHLQTHSDNLTTKSFCCRVCKKTFKEKWQMIRHEVCHKRIKTPSHVCKTCKKTFADQSQLEAHQTIHNVNKTYHCPKCNKIFFKEFSLMTHQCNVALAVSKRNPGSEKNARKASSALSSGNAKKRKSSKDHGAKSRNSNSKMQENERAKPRKDETLVELDNDTMPKLSPETSPSTSIPVIEPKIEISEEECVPTPVKRTLIRTAGGFRCGVCQSPFVLRELAVAHLRSAHPMMPYQCPYCKKRFTTQYTFTHHIKTDHPDESEN